MSKKFEMSMIGELTFFLGLQVKQISNGSIISQSKYITNMLKKFSFVDSKYVKTPMSTSLKIFADSNGVDINYTLCT